ncbi:MAG: preprotein translocase subunit SecG [Bacteroidia bacterium]|nr:preprotein translocase subunit SecG [Bacteroidia bacterium]
MYTVITWIIMVICVFLIITVLIQNSKGGGLTQQFASQQNLIGVRKSTDFLEKSTWTLAAAVMLFSFVAVALIPSQNATNSNAEIDMLLKNQQQQTAPAPTFPTPNVTDSLAD